MTLVNGGPLAEQMKKAAAEAAKAGEWRRPKDAARPWLGAAEDESPAEDAGEGPEAAEAG